MIIQRLLTCLVGLRFIIWVWVFPVERLAIVLIFSNAFLLQELYILQLQPDSDSNDNFCALVFNSMGLQELMFTLLPHLPELMQLDLFMAYLLPAIL